VTITKRTSPTAVNPRSEHRSEAGASGLVYIDVHGADVYPHPATGKDTNMTATRGFVVPAGGGKHLDMTAPGRFAALKLLGHETNESVKLFEETLPSGRRASSIYTATAMRSPGCSPARSPSRSATM
jgi:hypothetical protein